VELLTIPFSHYNERARWAMQHHGVVAHERRYLPMVHMRPVRAVVPPSQRTSDKTGSGLSTPVLVLDDGTVLNDSTGIVRWADETHGDEESTLYPAAHRDAIVTFEQGLHDDLGRDTRFLAYWFLIADGPAFAELVRHNVGWWQRALFAVGAPAAKAGMRKRFALTQPRYEKVRARVEAAVAELSEVLGDREYFFGDRFTAADLTSATMLAPALLPLPGYGAHIPELSDAFRELRDQLASTAVGRHTHRTFERHRGETPTGWTLG
jgi:glutathione S-transferase